MSQLPNAPHEPQHRGRALGWVLLIVGIVLCLGILSSLAQGAGSDTSGAAETAGLVIGRLLVIGIAVACIVFGARRLRR